MKIGAFATPRGASFGIVESEGVIDIGARWSGRWTDLQAVLEDDALARIPELAARLSPDHPVENVRWLKPIANPRKILCVGVNYPDRSAEYRDGAAAPEYPSLFVRFPRSLVAHGEPIFRPLESKQLDYEGEIAVVIGRRGRRIAEQAAMDHVAGVTAFNDGSVRDWIRHGKFNVTQGKNFEASGAIGPWLVTRDSWPGAALRVITRVNGEVRQDDTADHLIFPIPRLLAYISSFCTLEPGDVIATGTPTGAGARMDPPRYLVPGDLVEIEIPGVCVLRNPVEDEETQGQRSRRSLSLGP